MVLKDLTKWDTWWGLRFQVVGLILLALGLVTNILLAAAASATTPPTGAQSAFFVLVSAILNVGGVWLFSLRPGSATLRASRIALRHLGLATRGVIAARKRAEAAFEETDPIKVHEAVGHLSAELSQIEGILGSNLSDWFEAYPDLKPPSKQEHQNVEIESEGSDG